MSLDVGCWPSSPGHPSAIKPEAKAIASAPPVRSLNGRDRGHF